MAKLEIKLKRLLRKKGKDCYIRIGNRYDIDFYPWATTYCDCKNNYYEVRCNSIEKLELFFPNITSLEVINQTEKYGNPVFHVNYDVEKFKEVIEKSFKESMEEIIERRLKDTETSEIIKEIYKLGKQIISISCANDLQAGKALDELRRCYDEYDYKALQTMLYMIEHPEIKKAKVTYCYPTKQFWTALGHKFHRLKGNSNYCIEL